MTLRPVQWAGAAVLTLLASGCGDPLDRPGSWHAGDSNAANLVGAVIDKHDLIAGQPDSGADGQLAALAVQRLLHDKVKPLDGSSTTAGGTGGSPVAPN